LLTTKKLNLRLAYSESDPPLNAMLPSKSKLSTN